MKNVIRIFLLLALVVLASKVLFSDFYPVKEWPHSFKHLKSFLKIGFHTGSKSHFCYIYTK